MSDKLYGDSYTASEWLRRAGTVDEVIVEELSRLTSELACANRQLEQTRDQYKQAKEAAEVASAAKSLFLRNMSHELRTPLNAIYGFGQILLATERSKERREQLDIINLCCNDLLRMIQDMLEFSMIRDGKVTLKPREFDLRDELESLVTFYAAQAQKKDIILNTIISVEAPSRLCGDLNLINNILMNLVGNAIKFTKTGSIDIIVSWDQCLTDNELGLITFQVSDTGIGIRPDHLEQIFDIFEQEDNSSTRNFGGVGLGLAICRQLVTVLGGNIWVESKFGVGSHFFFSAPVNIAGAAMENAVTSGPNSTSRATREYPWTRCSLRCQLSSHS